MNEQAAKASRRDIRRAIGDNTIDLIDRHAHRIQTHDVLIGDAHKLIAEHSTTIERLRETVGYHGRLLDAHDRFSHRTFFNRMRWTMTGR